MAKTELTRYMEWSLRSSVLMTGTNVIGLFEVTTSSGIVDFLVKHTDTGSFTAFEIKSTVKDLHSVNKLSFVGDYNNLFVPESMLQDAINHLDEWVGIITYPDMRDELKIYHMLQVWREPTPKPVRDRDELNKSFTTALIRDANRYNSHNLGAFIDARRGDE